MQRVKWLHIDCETGLRSVGQKLSLSAFSVDSGWGFRVLARSNQELQCVFDERIVTHELVLDPFGLENEVETTRYSSIEFRLHRCRVDDGFVLEVVSPPRSLRSLINRLIDVVGQITVGEAKMPVMEIFHSLKTLSPRARIVRLRATGVEISTTSVARIDVVSSVDAVSDLLKLLPVSRDKIEKIRIERPFINTQGILEVGLNGVCAFDEAIDEAQVRSLILAIQ